MRRKFQSSTHLSANYSIDLQMRLHSSELWCDWLIDVLSWYSLKELGLLFSVSILQLRPSIFKEILRRFLAHFKKNLKKNQNILKGFFTFLARFSMSKKTQDVFGGFSSIFSRFFNTIKKNQDI